MEREHLEYVRLSSDKKAMHSFKNGGKPWSEVQDSDNIGLIVPKPFTVLDFDDEAHAKVMFEIIKALNLPVKVMKTTRGIHVWFRTDKQLKNFIKRRLAIGLQCDQKTSGANAYVVIKKDGVMREWLRECDDDKVMTVPKWLEPIRSKSDKFDFAGLTEGSRNDVLFTYIPVLQKAGFNREEVVETLEIVNRYVFSEPLSEDEFRVIVREEAFLDSTDDMLELMPDGKFYHNLFADKLLSNRRIISYNERLYVYMDGYYQPSTLTIEQELVKMYPSITKRQRAEVMDYIRIQTTIEAKDINRDPYVVNLMNGRLNLKTGILSPHDESHYDFTRVPVYFDPKAKCESVDVLLKKITCEDSEIENLMEEILADCLISKNIFQMGFIFHGNGSNGKSTWIKVIRKFIGVQNCSSIELDKLGTTFMTAELENKLVNLGDDLNYIDIKDNGTIKKLFSGENVQVQRKFEKPFAMESYATQIFSTNEIPRTADKSEGMMRRLCLVPFEAKFSPTDSDYNPFIFDEVSTQEGMSYLLNRAIRGFNRLMENRKFTEPMVAKKAKERYTIDNSTTLSWVEEKEIEIDYLLNTPVTVIYREFNSWCKDTGVKVTTGKKTFNKEIRKKFGFAEKTKQKRVGEKRCEFFVRDIDF